MGRGRRHEVPDKYFQCVHGCAGHFKDKFALKKHNNTKHCLERQLRNPIVAVPQQNIVTVYNHIIH